MMDANLPARAPMPAGNPTIELAEAAATWIATIGAMDIKTNLVDSEPNELAVAADAFNPDA